MPGFVASLHTQHSQCYSRGGGTCSLAVDKLNVIRKAASVLSVLSVAISTVLPKQLVAITTTTIVLPIGVDAEEV